jgi:DNA-binding response OmpR family regulator
MDRVRGKPRILVAEDDANDAFFLERAFAKAGVDAPRRFVRDGGEAVEYLEGRSGFADRSVHPMPTLLLLDLKMPRLSGFDVLKWLRQTPALHRLSVVVFSSSDDPNDVNLAYDLGANSYAVKPGNSAELLGFVRSLREYWLERHCFADCPGD